MNYIALNIAFSEDEQAEILTAELADYPFESFETEDGTLKAYIPQERLADCKAGVDALLARYGVQGRYIAIETQNWNAVWESNFPAVDVEGRLLIRAPFHDPAPEGVMEVVVMPKMSFGTGHHATTWLVSLGDVRRIAGRHYGFILANINRNILLADMPVYAAALDAGGDLVMSGFLEPDVPAITACAEKLGLRPVATAVKEGWVTVHVRKE